MTHHPSSFDALPLPRIVGWHLERDLNRLCRDCQQPSVVLVDYGDGCAVEACEDHRPTNASDEIGEMFAKIVKAATP